MSGITGAWMVHRRPEENELQHLGYRLVGTLAHRGIGSEVRFDPSSGVCLASVTPRVGGRYAGWSADRRYLLVACGQLAQRKASRSSIDDMLTSLPQQGIQATLAATEGAFCVAIWDAVAGTLTLARDRTGGGSLYYSCTASGLLFSTELRTLGAATGSRGEVDPSSVAQLFRYGYIPAPATIYRGVHKLPAGATRTFTASDIARGEALSASLDTYVPYWDLRHEAEQGMLARVDLGMAQSVRTVEEQLGQSVAECVEGATLALLSGGVDSSLIASLLQRQSGARIDTLSVGFADPRHDESHWAARVAGVIGARHTGVTVTDDDARALLDTLPRTFCEPFADSSALPMMLAARVAGRQWTTVLSGDGGDELFFGHGAYVRTLRNHALSRHVPAAMRTGARRLLARDPERARLGGLPALLAEMQASSLVASYQGRVSKWRNPSAALHDIAEPLSLFTDQTRHLNGGHRGDTLLYLDQATELADGLMTRSDRAFGAQGIRVGNPFLSERMVRLSWAMPFAHKYAGGHTKEVLKQALERHLPAELVRRPKMGLGSPVARWLQGPLRDWAESLLDPVQMRSRGIVSEPVVSRLWQEFIAGRRKFHSHLWPVLMFQAWDREWNGAGTALDTH